VLWQLRVRNVPRPLSLALTSTPLLLFAMGCDAFRWVQLLWVELLLVLVVLGRAGLVDLPALPTWRRWLLLACLVPLGPLGVSTGLPYVGNLVGMLR
jgi:hypothetical protein